MPNLVNVLLMDAFSPFFEGREEKGTGGGGMFCFAYIPRYPDLSHIEI